MEILDVFFRLVGVFTILGMLVVSTIIFTLTAVALGVNTIMKNLTPVQWKGIALGMLGAAMDEEQRIEFRKKYEEWANRAYRQKAYYNE